MVVVTEHEAADRASRPLAPPLPELSAAAEVALLCRILAREGAQDHLTGQVSERQADGTILVDPYGMTWDEVTERDIMRADADGHVVDGPWTVTPVFNLHVALYRARPDVNVIVHNHSPWALMWGAAGRVPPVYDQTSAGVLGDPALFSEYDGPVAEADRPESAIEALGDARMALLAHHGVLVVAPNLPVALHRTITLEWRCRQAWHVEMLGGGTPVEPAAHADFGGRWEHDIQPGVWEALIRRELRADPGILS